MASAQPPSSDEDSEQSDTFKLTGSPEVQPAPQTSEPVAGTRETTSRHCARPRKHDGALAETETVWGDVIADLTSTISLRDQAGKASSRVLADTQETADTPGQLEAARASVAQVRADVPDVTTPAALPAPCPDSRYTPLAEMQKALRRLLRIYKTPSTWGVDGYIAVPMAVFKSWKKATSDSGTPLLPLQWPDVAAPLRWRRDVADSDVVLLPPGQARGVVELVGGRDLLALQESYTYSSLLAEDGKPRFIDYVICDRRGGGQKDLGWHLLPATWTVRAALTAVMGKAPHVVTGSHGNTVELGQTCLELRQAGWFGTLNIIQGARKKKKKKTPTWVVGV